MQSIRSRIVHYLLRFLVRPRLTAEIDIPGQRRALETRARLVGVPKGTEVREVDAGGVKAEWVSAPDSAADRVVLYLHGGGFALGSLATHRNIAARLAARAGVRVLVIDYRLAPEHPFPAALDDCVTAYRWLFDCGVAPRHIAIAGDSAGGNLTVTTLLKLRDLGLPPPAAAVCFSPFTDASFRGESFSSRAAADPMLTPEWVEAMLPHYIGDTDPLQPFISPIYGDLSGLPPLLVQVGGNEILHSDAMKLAELARMAGVDVTFEEWPGMWHVFQLFATVVPESRRALEAAGAFLKLHLR